MEEPTRTQDRLLERGVGGSFWLREDRRGRLRFSPMTVIVIASVLTIVLLGGLGVHTWQSYQDYQHILNCMEAMGQKNTDINIQRYQQRAMVSVTLVLVEITSVLLIWFLALRNMRKYHKERNRIDRALQESEKQYRSLFENSSDCILLVRKDNSIFDANQQSSKVLGYSYEELLRMTVMDLHPETEQKRANELRESSIKTGGFEEIEDMHYRHKNGRLIPVSITTTIIRSVSKPMAMVHFRDISERKLGRQALMESEKRFRSLVDNIPGTVYQCELSFPWGVAHISEAVFDITGYHSSDFLEGEIDFGRLILSEDADEVIRIVEESVANHTAFEVEYRLRHLDGSVRWVHENGVAVYDENDTAVLLDGVIVDVTHRKLAEQELERLAKTLATKNEELQSIVYVASHDLKTPLVNIMGFSGELSKTYDQLKSILESHEVDGELRAKLAPLVYEDAPEALRFIVAGGSRMHSLLNGLLEISRVGSSPLHMETLDMNGIMQGLVASMQFQISDSGAEVNIDHLPQCKADDDSINQVFSNLLANAVKYLDSKRQGVINVTGEVVDGEVIYCVEDNGLGIASGQCKKIFDIFHRLNPGGNVKGDGLGLTIALRILERHGGRIWVESEQGKGSRFFVSLPAA